MLLLWANPLWWDQRWKTVIQFCYFFTVHFYWGSPNIKYQPSVRPEPTATHLWWNSTENNEFALQNICWENWEKKSNRPLNPKPIELRPVLFLFLRKHGREVFAEIRLRLTLMLISLKIQQKRNKMLCVLYWSFLWRPQCWRADTMCEIHKFLHKCRWMLWFSTSENESHSLRSFTQKIQLFAKAWIDSLNTCDYCQRKNIDPVKDMSVVTERPSFTGGQLLYVSFVTSLKSNPCTALTTLYSTEKSCFTVHAIKQLCTSA